LVADLPLTAVNVDAPRFEPGRAMIARGAIVALLTLAALDAPAAAGQTAAQDLKTLTLEQLMDIRVTVVSRQPEPVGTAAAAAIVITRDDIRRSGVTTIADALALADGMHVARFNNGSWSITARGFNGSTPNKLLVMVDGRTDYSPLFTGVFWNLLDYVLEDVERIEIIRGPSATMWGANAINGVVNIITRNARETHGTYVSAATGNEDPALVEVRHGGGTERLSYRVYGKFARRDQQLFSTGIEADDTRRRGMIGLRLDSTGTASDWMIKADGFHSRDGLIDRRDAEWTHLAAQGRFTRRFSPQSSVQLQAYYRREYRNVERQLTHHLDTGDVDFQHSLAIGARNRFIWGGGFRVNTDVTYGSEVIRFDPPRRTYPVASAFAQDEFVLKPERLAVTAGVKIEHNAFSGADLQPSMRVRWTLPRNQMVWGAVARAVRRPTRFDDDLEALQNDVVLAQGSDDFVSEEMTGWDVGYRSRPLGSLSLDVNVFSQYYDRLRSQEAAPTGLFPLTLGNTLNGRSSGVEMSATVQPHPWWRTRASYTYWDTDISRDANSRDISNGVSEMNDPHHLFTLRSSVDLPRRIAVDGWLRGVSRLPNPVVPGYVELDGRIGWEPSPRIELALVGQDLLHNHHPEFGSGIPRRTEFERSVRVVVTLRVPANP
jgi:iron complex outermembrane receptor protein